MIQTNVIHTNVIHVQIPGMFTTVQDLGRYGYGPLGVSPSGAADPISLRIGNLLVGNPENTAALEMTLLGGTFLFPDGGVVALAGSDFGPMLSTLPSSPTRQGGGTLPGDDLLPSSPTRQGGGTLPGDDLLPSSPTRQGGGTLPGGDLLPSSPTRQGGGSLPGDDLLPSSPTRQGGGSLPGDDLLPSSPTRQGGGSLPIPMHTAFDIPPGGILKTGPSRNGARCYLCVTGGIAVRPLLGSASTHILTGLGGFEGRALRKGDVLDVGQGHAPPVRAIDVGQGHALPTHTIDADTLAKLARRKALRTTIAPQTDWFSADSLRFFYESAYTVSEESNRMGLRLQGPVIETPRTNAPHQGQMTSEGVSLGAIQIPAGGQPIILFVEQQTTGGYPKIANIISADLPSIGQLRPRDQIRFELVTPETARALILEQEALISKCTST